MECEEGRHSGKPSAVRQLVETESPGPYLELYGRELPASPMWTAYQNQVQRLTEE